MHEQTEHYEHRSESGAWTGADPVCGMKVPLSSPHRYAVNGSEVVFCSTRPVEKHDGDHVIGSTVNGTGGLIMRADKVGAETLLSRIVAMMAEAQRRRAPIQRLADVVAGYFVPVVLLIAVATFVVWSLVGPDPRMAHALINAVAVLIIACPCSLGLATLMSIMVATGKGATMGVLFKNAEAIEVLRKVGTLVVDKTGTLTEGKPKLVLYPFFGLLLSPIIAAAAMSFSSVSVVANALRLRRANV